MSYENILETRGDFRVKLIIDEYADEPYDDSQSPLLRIDRGHPEHIQIGGRPTDDDARIEEAVTRWVSTTGNDWSLFKKYLKAYYGVTKIETWYSGSYWYVTYDSAAWQKFIGVGDPKYPDFTNPGPNMDEYKAYCEGEVYYYVVEKRVYLERSEPYLDGSRIIREETDEWEQVDSCGGFYGSDYAEQAALEALNYEAPI